MLRSSITVFTSYPEIALERHFSDSLTFNKDNDPADTEPPTHLWLPAQHLLPTTYLVLRSSYLNKVVSFLLFREPAISRWKKTLSEEAGKKRESSRVGRVYSYKSVSGIQPKSCCPKPGPAGGAVSKAEL